MEKPTALRILKLNKTVCVSFRDFKAKKLLRKKAKSEVIEILAAKVMVYDIFFV